jgi:uncharacterized protein (DUF362 family)
MKSHVSRREFLGAAGMVVGAHIARPALASALKAPASRVAIGQCPEYNRQVTEVLATMFDQLGGLEKLVRGKTVAIKLNMTGLTNFKLNSMPNQMTHWVHPQVIGSLISLLGNAGAQRVRLLESAPIGTKPLEDFMLAAGWQPKDFTSAAKNVEFENTNFLGGGKTYARFMVPGGGLMYSGFDLNHSYLDTDVFVSLAKFKEHRTAGVTLSMKNCFGITPVTIYGDGAGSDEPSIEPHGGRGIMHDGHRQPSKSAPPEHDPATPRDDGYRVPRIVADLVAARPIDLAIVEAVRSMAGGEGPWVKPSRAIRPGVLVAGTNCVATDAVCMAVMGYDPMAVRGTPPFEKCDSTLQLAEALGVGPRDLRRIELAGTPLREALFHYRV